MEIPQEIYPIISSNPSKKDLVKEMVRMANEKIMMRDALRKIAGLVREMEDIVDEEKEKSLTMGNKIMGRGKDFSEKAKSYEDISIHLRDILSDVRNM